MLIDTKDPNANWWDVLSLWNRVVNWSHYRTSERDLNVQIKSLLIHIWSEKDWLKKQFVSQATEIEGFVNRSIHLKVVADLANTTKHRNLRQPRSVAQQTEYFGRVRTGRGAMRRLHLISTGGGAHPEIMQVLRGAIEELEELRGSLSDGVVEGSRSNCSIWIPPATP